MDNLYDKIKLLCDDQGISTAALSSALGISRSTFTEIKSGRAKTLGVDKINSIANHFNVPSKFLTGEPPFDMWDAIKNNREALLYCMCASEGLLFQLFGVLDISRLSLVDYIKYIDSTIDNIRLSEDGDFDIKVKPWITIQMNADEEAFKKNNPDLPPDALPFTRGQRIPIYGSIPAGHPNLAIELIEGYDYADVSNAGDYFFLRVKGNSMINAHIFDGDLVLIKIQNCAENGDIIACLVNGDEATLKRFYRQGETVVLQPENSEYHPSLVSCKDFENGNARILGVAKEIKRKL